jgi:flagellar biosynthesis/type III secretory pathway protein FliH
MNGSLLKTSATQPSAVATLAGHPRASSASVAGVPGRQMLPEGDGTPPEDARAAQLRLAEELDGLRRAAHEDGLRQGKLDAQRQVDLAVARQEAALHGLIGSINDAVRDRLADLEEFALAIAFEACGTVLSEASRDGRAVTDVVRRLLLPLRQASGVRVQLNPDDLARVSQAVLSDPHANVHPLRFDADSSLKTGDCRIVTTHGQLESGLAIQLNAIRDSLLNTHAELQAPRGHPQ